MNKKVNTVLFILGATVANVLIMLVIFLVLFVIFGRLIAPSLPPQVNQIVMLLLFIGSIVATYFIYHRLVKWLSDKYDLDKYFDPIFRKGGQKKNE
jgi:membrane protein YdbS with pleckstrin-like domain